MTLQQENKSIFQLIGKKNLSYESIQDNQLFLNLETLAEFNEGSEDTNVYKLIDFAKNGILNIIKLRQFTTIELNEIYDIKSPSDYNLIINHYERRIKQKVNNIFYKIIKYKNTNQLNYSIFNYIRKAKNEIIYNCNKYQVKYNNNLKAFETGLIRFL